MTPRELAQELANMVNSVLPEKHEEFIDEILSRTHRTLQQNIMRYVVLGLIEAWAEKYEKEHDKYFDLRNEATGRLCKRIVETFDKYERNLPHI